MFTVHAQDKEWYEAHEVQGLCQTSKLRIDVHLSEDDRFTFDTLWHEINHALWWVLNLKEKKDDEERIVRSLTTGQLMVLADNWQLRSLISEVLQ